MPSAYIFHERTYVLTSNVQHPSYPTVVCIFIYRPGRKEVATLPLPKDHILNQIRLKKFANFHHFMNDFDDFFKLEQL